MKLKRGDQVIILSGKDRGKKGLILEARPKVNLVVVEGAQIQKKHQKSTGTRARGGIIAIPRPIPAGKVSILCPACEKPTRVGYQRNQSGKFRACRKCGQPLERPLAKEATRG